MFHKTAKKLPELGGKVLALATIVCCIVLGESFLGLSADGSILQLDDQSISLEVEQVPLTLVLDELTRQGIRIRIDPGINPKISASFKNRPIGSAIESILRPLDHVLIWERDGTSPVDEPKVSEIQIFRSGQSGDRQPLYQSPNLSVARGRNGDLYVAGTLLLVLDSDPERSELAALLAGLDATIIDRNEELGILRLRMPQTHDIQEIADLVSDLPGIRIAEPDYVHSLEQDAPLKSLTQFGESLQHAKVEGAVVAVLDSGLAPAYERSPFVAGTYDAVVPGRKPVDQVGHGTQMVLVASGAVVPLGSNAEQVADTPVIAIRAFDDNGYTSNYTLLRGIDFALKNDAKVVSLSWGTAKISPLLGSVVDYADREGLVVVAAAGNAPTGEPVYPAALKSVIGVGALSASGNVWPRSNYGEAVSVYAHGLAELPGGAGGFAALYAGTSIAAAYTARRIAGILATNPSASRTTIVRQLSQPAR
jgi:hypothetical protein